LATVLTSSLFARRAELLRELATLEESLGAAVTEALEPEPADETLGLEKAAELVGEPPETFRRRPEYLKARVSRPGEGGASRPKCRWPRLRD
jgi:hypothetical protein